MKIIAVKAAPVSRSIYFFIFTLLLLLGGCKHFRELYAPSSYTIDPVLIDPYDAKIEILNGYKNYAGKVVKISPANGINWADFSRPLYYDWNLEESGQFRITVSISALIEESNPVPDRPIISAYRLVPRIWKAPTEIDWNGPANLGWTIESGEDYYGQFGGNAVQLPSGKWTDLDFSQTITVNKSGQIYIDGHNDSQGLLDMTLYIRHYKVTMEKSNNYIALTFDNSPTDFTDALLDKLESLNVKATFFLLGTGISASHPIQDRILTEITRPEKSEEREATVRRILESGHEAAILSYSYDFFTDDSTLSETAIRSEIEATQIAIQKAAYGEEFYLDYPWVSGLLRAPLISDPVSLVNLKNAAREMDLPIIAGFPGSDDFLALNDEEITKYVRDKYTSWNISINGDPRTQTSVIKLLDEIVPRLKADGFEFVTISEMAENSGTPLVPGEVYYDFKP